MNDFCKYKLKTNISCILINRSIRYVFLATIITSSITFAGCSRASEKSETVSSNTDISTSNNSKLPSVKAITLTLPKTSITVDDVILANVEIVTEASNPTTTFFASSDSSVATVDSNGSIKALKNGTTIIIAKAGDKESKVQLTVIKTATSSSSTSTLNNSLMGNTPGNLVNGGEFAQSGNFIYYNNSADNKKFYKMKLDGSEKIKINDDTPLNISIVDSWIYYTNTSDYRKIYKVNLDGGNKDIVTDDKANEMVIQGDWVYYVNSSDDDNIYKIKTDGSEKKKIVDEYDNKIAGHDLNVSGNYIYYNDKDAKGIYRIGIDGNNLLKLNSDKAQYMNVVNDWIYYTTQGDRLYKMKIDGSKRMKLNDDTSFFINVVGDWIYYTDINDRKIYKIKIDGSSKSVVNDKASTDRDGFINVVNDKIYYLDNYSPKYKYIPIDGSSDPKELK